MSDLDVIREIEYMIGKELKLCPVNESIFSMNGAAYLLTNGAS